MHNPHLHFHISSLFPRKLSKSMKELYGSVAILGFAMSAATLFEPIYLWSLGYGIRGILYYYLITYVLYALFLPLGGKFTAHFGYERSILVGSLFLIAYYILLFGIGAFPILYFVAPAVFAVQKTFYWVGFHADFAVNSSRGERGREIGEANLLTTMITIIGPIAGGMLIARFGFPALYSVVAILIVLSNIPLFRTFDRLPKGSFGYRNAFRQLVAPSQRRRFATYLGYGEEHALLVLWPVFLFVTLGSVLGVGVITTCAAFFASFALLFIGRSVDLQRKDRPHRWGVIWLAVTWLFRTIVTSGWLLFLVDASYRLANGAVQFPILTERYESVRGSSIVGGIVFFEQVLALAKVLFSCLILLVLPYFGDSPWAAIFAFAAAVSLFYALLPKLKTSARS